jgi:hypothetical protein
MEESATLFAALVLMKQACQVQSRLEEETNNSIRKGKPKEAKGSRAAYTVKF